MGGIFSKKKQTEEVDEDYDNGLNPEQEKQLEMDKKKIEDLMIEKCK
jgi:hypothetical protein